MRESASLIIEQLFTSHLLCGLHSPDARDRAASRAGEEQAHLPGAAVVSRPREGRHTREKTAGRAGEPGGWGVGAGILSSSEKETASPIPTGNLSCDSEFIKAGHKRECAE